MDWKQAAIIDRRSSFACDGTIIRWESKWNFEICRLGLNNSIFIRCRPLFFLSRCIRLHSDLDSVKSSLLWLLQNAAQILRKEVCDWFFLEVKNETESRANRSPWTSWLFSKNKNKNVIKLVFLNVVPLFCYLSSAADDVDGPSRLKNSSWTHLLKNASSERAVRHTNAVEACFHRLTW